MSNSSSSSNTSRGGIGFFGVLTIVFIVLKLVGTITWPWIWVLAPLWVGFVVFGAVVVVIIICAAIATVLS